MKKIRVCPHYKKTQICEPDFSSISRDADEVCPKAHEEASSENGENISHKGVFSLAGTHPKISHLMLLISVVFLLYFIFISFPFLTPQRRLSGIQEFSYLMLSAPPMAAYLIFMVKNINNTKGLAWVIYPLCRFNSFMGLWAIILISGSPSWWIFFPFICLFPILFIATMVIGIKTDIKYRKTKQT